ncbi:methyl-accepting chemotaxis protein [Cohnella thailandensis]|uniref:CHASE3 domain-containing protein n=1 Tax=Cohnella thailandensis TaxID=557557 RepID=A0A841SZR6_9BACL|nr:methyl-accepting chemotaxis protein [Cohnella thailandensis]MBB6635745.1 CHASE3 domain-containing protein [Cohnella thailandensis]MBP1976123.1 methyl-accepting chemotaxis protein [Cohnella thailandensis]
MKLPAIRLNRIQNKIALGFLIVILCFIIVILLVTDQLSKFQRETDYITNHDMKVRSLAQSLEKDIVDMQQGILAYVVSGEKDSLDPYTYGQMSWKTNYAALTQLIADNPDPVKKLQVIQENVEGWVKDAGEVAIALKQANDSEGLAKYVHDDPGKKYESAIRVLLSNFKDAEEKQSAARVEELKKKNDRLRVQLYVALAIVVAVSAVSGYLTGYITVRNVRKVGAAIAEIASSGGDLTKRIRLRTKDETKDLADQANLLLSSLQGMISDIQASTKELERSSALLRNGSEESSRASDQIAQSVGRVAQGTEQQVSQTQQISAIIEETVSGLEQVAATTSGVSLLAQRTQSVAFESANELKQNVDNIRRIESTFSDIHASATELSRLSGQVGEVVDRIKDISKQTNLLSLNAAIEAARAGEHGKGFAVVADEIRKLSDQAARSTTEIADTIEVMLGGISGLAKKVRESGADVKNGVEAMWSAGKSFRTIMEEIDSLSAQVTDVASTIEQMSAGSKSVEAAIQEIAKITEETASFSEEVAAMTEEQTATSEEMRQAALKLNGMSESLQSLVGKFKV